MRKMWLFALFVVWIGSISSPPYVVPHAHAGAGPHLENPFEGAKFYLNVDFIDVVKKSSTKEGGEIGQKMLEVAKHPTFVWLDSIAAIHGKEGYPRSLADHLEKALEQGANAIGLVIYNLPNRDGSALASNGELLVAERGFERYKSEYIDEIYTVIKQDKFSKLRIIMVIEPDSLPNLVTNLEFKKVKEAHESGAYMKGVQYAVGKLRSLENTYAYIDVGHAGWMGWPSNFDPFVKLLKEMGEGIDGGCKKVDGFISNVANYNPFHEPFMRADQDIGGQPVRSLAGWYEWNDYIDEKGYLNALRAALIKGEKAYPNTIGLLVDTSRNGWGGEKRPKGPSSAKDLKTFVRETTIDKRHHKGNWANQSGAGLGARPQASPEPNFHAFVWVKAPGESDGSSRLIPKGPDNPTGKGFDQMCDPDYKGNKLNGSNPTGAMKDAPVAGRWFHDHFKRLVENAYPPLNEAR